MLFKALCSLAVIGMLFGGCESEEATNVEETKAATQVEQQVEEAKEVEQQAEEEAVPMGHKQALKSAESYLEHSSFSKKGLFHQLTSEYGEGFTEEEAQYAVDNVEVDWKEEAVESAESYLEYSSFSKNELLNQLTSEYGENFTEEEAQYAVEKVYK